MHLPRPPLVGPGQRLFVPRQIKTDMGMAAGKAGAGYDVLEAKRSNPGYSPLCQIWNYGDPAMPMEVAELPRSPSGKVRHVIRADSK